MQSRLTHFMVILCVALSLSGCFLKGYRPDIQQGNILVPAKIAQIRSGMTTSQVTHLLGEPLMTNIYHDGRMIYIYTFQHGRQKIHIKRLLIYFRYGHVTRKAISIAPGRRLPPPQ